MSLGPTTVRLSSCTTAWRTGDGNYGEEDSSDEDVPEARDGVGGGEEDGNSDGDDGEDVSGYDTQSDFESVSMDSEGEEKNRCEGDEDGYKHMGGANDEHDGERGNLTPGKPKRGV